MNLGDLISLRQAGVWGPTRVHRNIMDHLLRGLQLSASLEFVQESHTAAVTCLAVDSDEKQYLLAGLGDGTLCIHNIFGTRKNFGYSSKVELRIGRNHPDAHSHSLQTVSWFTDNGMFLTSGRDGKLKVWDTNEGVVVEQFTVGSVINQHRLAAPEVGAVVAVVSDTNHVQLVDLNTGSTCHTLRGHSGEVLTCSWSTSNPRVLASGAADSKIILWDVRQSRTFLSTLDYNNVRYKRSKDIKLAGMSHQSSVHGLEFSGCGRFLYSLGKDKRIRKWDTVTLKNLKTKFPEVETKCKGSVDICSTSEAKEDLLFVPENNNVAVFNTMTGVRLVPLVGHYSSVYSAVYCRDRSVLYTGGRDRFVLVWDTPLHQAAAAAAKIGDGEENKDINPYTTDTWSSDEEG